MKNTKIYIAGHKGMVGSAVARKYESEGYHNLLMADYPGLDLTKQEQVESFIEREMPEQIIVAAAKVGGILANNTYRAEFLYDNLMIEANIIHAAHKYGIEKLLFLGSSCIYPKMAPQPLKEEYLLTGSLEYTNEPYAVAKIAGIKLCENYYKQYGSNFFSVMPTNLYGPGDNFDLKASHVLPALIRKIHESKIQSEITSEKPELMVWGSGKPKREFLFVEDLADAIFYLMNNIDAKDLYENDLTHINIGTGEDLTISELVNTIINVIGFKGEIKYDTSKPDGTPRKLMDVSRINELGWKHKTILIDGIEKTYDWYLSNKVKR